MKFVSFQRGAAERTGAILPSGAILDLAAAAHRAGVVAPFNTMLELIAGGAQALDAARRLQNLAPDEAIIPMAEVRLLAPVRPPRLRDTLMFLQHMENGLEKWARNLASEQADPEAAYAELKASGKYSLHPVFKEKVIYYNADHLSVSGPDDEIHWPALSDYADYELEWAVVIGQSRRGIPAAEAKSAIFGYTVYNDWSARDLQLSFMQANLGPAEGKDFACSNGLGPCIVTPDELSDPYSLRMTAHVNGELWSEGVTGTMYHRFEDAIAQFSRFEDLTPGEVIGSGTVLNGCGYELGRRLSDGDVVELAIEGIGVLRNTVRIPPR